MQIASLLISYQEIESFYSFEKEIIEKALFYLNTNKIPLNSYIFKVEACHLLKNVALKFSETKEYRIGAYNVIFF